MRINKYRIWYNGKIIGYDFHDGMEWKHTYSDNPEEILS